MFLTLEFQRVLIDALRANSAKIDKPVLAPFEGFSHFSICACHPCTGAIANLVCIVPIYRMIPKGKVVFSLLPSKDEACIAGSLQSKRRKGKVRV